MTPPKLNYSCAQYHWVAGSRTPETPKAAGAPALCAMLPTHARGRPSPSAGSQLQIKNVFDPLIHSANCVFTEKHTQASGPVLRPTLLKAQLQSQHKRVCARSCPPFFAGSPLSVLSPLLSSPFYCLTHPSISFSMSMDTHSYGHTRTRTALLNKSEIIKNTLLHLFLSCGNTS